MFTQQLSANDQVQSGNGSGWAIIFFLLGAPHIYSFVQQRSQRQSNVWVLDNPGWLITLLAGGLVLLLLYTQWCR